MTEEENKIEQIAEAVQPQEEAPAPEASEPAEETPEQQQDRILMELDGEPDPDDLVEADGAPEETSVLGGEPREEEESGAPSLSEEHEQAIAVLKRDGWTSEDLEALPAERLLSIAEHRRKVQSDIDRKLRERQQPEPAEETDKDSGESHAEPNPDQPSVANLSEQATAVADYLGLDDSGKDLLVQFQQAAVQPMQKLIDEQRAALQAVQQQLLFTELERARVALEDRYPQARDTESERWGNVLDRMGKMWSDGSDLPAIKAMEDAILLEFRDELTQQARESKSRVATLRDQGQPTARSRPEATPVYSTPEEREDAVLRILESNDPDKYARARAIGKATN